MNLDLENLEELENLENLDGTALRTSTPIVIQGIRYALRRHLQELPEDRTCEICRSPTLARATHLTGGQTPGRREQGTLMGPYGL